MRQRFIAPVIVAVTAVVLAATAAPAAAQAPELSTESVVSGLTIPTDIVFTPDGAMIYSERGGTAAGSAATRFGVVLLGGNGTVDPDDERRQLTADLADAVTWNGVMSIALSPDFVTDRALFTCQGSTSRSTKVVRWTVDAGYTALTRQADLVTSPWGAAERAPEHIGCRVRFDAEGKLFVSLGDTFTGTNAQNPGSLNGKVLRIDPTTGAGVPGNMGSAWRGFSPVSEFASSDVSTATIEYAGQLHVFGPSASGRGLRHAWYDPAWGRWFGETVDDGTDGGNGESSTVVAYRGELHVFGDTRTGDGVRHQWYSPAAGQWFSETLDAVGSSGSGVSVSIYAGQLHLFGRATTGAGWRHLWFDGAWNAETLDAAGTSGASSDSMIFAGNGELQVFGPATGGGLRHGWFTPGAGWFFETLGASVTTGENPVAFMYGSQLQVLADGTAPGVTGQVFYDGTAWIPATLDAGTDPSQLLWSGDGALHVFGAPAAGGGVRHGWYSPVAGQWNYETLDAPVAAGTGTTASGYRGQLHVFGAAGPGGIRQTFFAPSPFDARIYTYGHRNPQGLALQPGTGRMYEAEHGSDRDDEINLLVAGGNYGWDPVPGYNESVPMTDLVKFPAARTPVWAAGRPSVATSGLTFLTGPQWQAWDGALVAANLKTQKLIVVKLSPDGRDVEWQTQTLSGIARLRTPVQGPDGNLYVTTSRSGGADEIIKVTPEAPAPPP